MIDPFWQTTKEVGRQTMIDACVRSGDNCGREGARRTSIERGCPVWRHTTNVTPKLISLKPFLVVEKSEMNVYT